MDNILIVDDDATSIYLTKRLIKANNISSNVVQAANGLEALKYYEAML
ncbi:hypothetical protein [Adhaeribacter aquaticus]|nr:hypothetical protein [Adhaeribacter aquaticus]